MVIIISVLLVIVIVLFLYLFLFSKAVERFVYNTLASGRSLKAKDKDDQS